MDPRDIYDDAFFTQIRALPNRLYTTACQFIAKEIYRRFVPTTAVDWGCGAGLHCQALAQLGVHAIGVDAVAVSAPLRAPDAEIKYADLTQPVPPALTFENYDLSLCIDVMEHLPDEDSEAALTNITRGAKLVILSCAPPGQGGHHHVNERPRRYWISKMAQLGWHYQRRETGNMERYFLEHRDTVPFSWMYHNLCVYRPCAYNSSNHD